MRVRSCLVLVLTACAGCSGAAKTSAGGATDAGPPAATEAGAQAPDGGSGPRVDGGSPEAATAAPPVTCAGTPAEVGVWQEVSPAVFHQPSNMQVQPVAVNPLDGTVFSSASNVTNGGTPPMSTAIYKSSDCGATWSLASTGAHGQDLATGSQWAILIDPVTPSTLYADNGYGDDMTLFQSLNGGVDWQPLDIDPCGVTAPVFSQAVAMDPTNHLHIAVTFHENCGTAATASCSVAPPTTPMCLSQSSDGGQTWSYVNGPPSLAGWQESASLMALGVSTSLLLTPDNGGWLTLDGGATWTPEITNYGLYGTYAGSAHLASDGALYVGVANTGIYSSRADATHQLGESWSLIAGSPQASALVDDGVNLYAAYNWDTSGAPYYWAPLSDVTKWTHMTTSTDPLGSNEFAYDPTHNLIYAASGTAGLWRLRTR